MAKCDLCREKIGFMDGKLLQNMAGTIAISSVRVCDKCEEQLNKLLLRDKAAYTYIHGFIDESNKNDLRTFVKQWEGKCKSESVIKEENEKRERQIELEKIGDKMILTTGNIVEGMKIEKYIGLVSGSTVLGTGVFSEIEASTSDFFGVESNGFSDKVEQARKISEKKLVDSAAKMHADAIIGIAYDYFMVKNNMFSVVMNGTAVKLKSK